MEELKNSSNSGIRKLTQITGNITELWYGSGNSYYTVSTGNDGINFQAYKYRWQSIFYPNANIMTMYGKWDNDTTVEFNSTRPGFSGYPHTDNGLTVFASHTDAYNTIGSALYSVAIEGRNEATRTSGSNALTNYGGKFSATGGQNNYSLLLGNPAQYEANYGSLFTDRSLPDKRYVDSLISTVGGGSPVYYVDTIYNNGTADSLIWEKNGIRYAVKYPSGGGGSGWGLALTA